MQQHSPGRSRQTVQQRIEQTVRATTLVLVGLAVAILQVALFPSQTYPWLQSVPVMFVILVSVACSRLLRTDAGTKGPSAAVSLFLTVLFLTPYGLDFLFRIFFDLGNPLEILLIFSLRNLAIGSALISANSTCRRVAAVSSFILVFFSFLLPLNALTIVLLAAYSLVAFWWLMESYWDRLRGKFPSESRREAPVAVWTSIAALMLLLLTGCFWLASTDVGTRAMAGFFPSSGGSSRSDPYAREGVGDGDMLVGGIEDASAFGAVNSQIFLEGKNQSLYDIEGNELGPIPKKVQRAIALGRNELNRIRDDGERRAQTKRSGKEFSAVRMRSHRNMRRSLEDRDSGALFAVTGRTPLHLRQYVYDTFDGKVWWHRHPEPPPIELTLEQEGETSWIRTFMTPDSELFAAGDSHRLKIYSLDTNRVPAPVNVERVSIDKLRDNRFFLWSADNVLSVIRDNIPAYTVIDMYSRVADRKTLAGRNTDLAKIDPARRQAYGSPLARQKEIDDLVHSWVANVPSGWRQVEAIVSRMADKDEYVVDRLAVAPEDCDNVVAHFLLDAGRGPDYMFASAATVALQSLGYRARFVEGFYADPGNYDYSAKQTSVFSDNLHFWVEVQLADGNWVVVEPTPGYRVLEPRMSWRQLAAAAIVAVWDWSIRNALGIALAAAATVIVCLFHRHALYLCGLARYWIGSWRSPERQVTSTVRLMDWAARMGRFPRPASRTLWSWYMGLAELAGNDELQATTARLLAITDQAFYAPAGAGNGTWKEERVRAACRQAIRFWTPDRMRQLKRIQQGMK